MMKYNAEQLENAVSLSELYSYQGIQGIQGTSDGDHIAQQGLMITSSSKIGMTGHVLKMLVL